jgi:molecular chaperone DnaK (HSP70)
MWCRVSASRRGQQVAGPLRPERHPAGAARHAADRGHLRPDANGILNVSAKDKATGKEQKFVIKASGGLSDDEIEQMVDDAEANAEADKKFEELITARNSCEGLVHAAQRPSKKPASTPATTRNLRSRLRLPRPKKRSRAMTRT